ncbi:RNase adapter RapZ [Candidatus Poribacteria bacterium]|nr:RNase adapter RapZ [Candidatus Poribacteria bacterium]
MKILFITGLSGAGKSEVVKIFEDMGYFCIDNLPVMLIDKFIEICTHTERSIDRVALVIDIRERDFLENFCNVLENLEQANLDNTILFLEAKDEILIRRYSATRRKHPLGEEGTIWDNIRKEQKILASIREKATVIIDTSNLTLNELKKVILDKFTSKENICKMLIRVCAFGYKYGIPLDADLVFDVRFLPNPHYIDELKPYTGKDELVKKFVINNSITQEFLNKFYSFIDFSLPNYALENKAYLTIAIGCTGGKHRSVVIADEIIRHLGEKDYLAKAIYRDLGRE